MTGRDLIIFIMQNHLEDVQIFEDGKIPGYVTAEEAAIKMNVGIETIKLLYQMNKIRGMKIGDNLYISTGQ